MYFQNLAPKKSQSSHTMLVLLIFDTASKECMNLRIKAHVQDVRKNIAFWMFSKLEIWVEYLPQFFEAFSSNALTFHALRTGRLCRDHQQKSILLLDS